MTRYLTLLRGVNVGGNNKVTMRDLVAAMTEDGFVDVKSYINSGNVLFSSKSDKDLEKKVASSIKRHSGLDIEVVIFTADQWLQIVEEAPDFWGKNPDWKHNLLVMIPPYKMNQVIRAIGSLKPDLESLVPGRGVLYQSVSLKSFGRTSAGKLAANPIYKKMTVRNYNTAIKLGVLLSTNEQ